MKHLILSITLLSFSFLTAQETHQINIEFSGITSKQGVLYVGLYDSEVHFLNKRYKEIAIPINELKASAIFEEIPDGTYAISAYHDENDNGKMDTKFFFIPKEPVGTSNNTKGKYGPPKFEDAKFSLNEDLTLKITMQIP